MAILVQSNKKPSVSFPSQTGSIVTFNSQYAGLPLKTCIVNIPVTQEGTGDPSPYNVRTINGYSAIHIGAVGDNVWDETTKQGYYHANGGYYVNVSGQLCSNTFIAVQPNTTYRFCKPNTQGDVLYYGSDKSYLNQYSGSVLKNGTFTTPSGCYYITINLGNNYGATYNNDVIIAYPSGTYTTIQIGSTIYGGNRDARTGVLTVTHEIIDLGSINYTYRTDTTKPIFQATNVIYAKRRNSAYDIGNDKCSIYKTVSSNDVSQDGYDYSFAISVTGRNIYIQDSRYTVASDFKTAMSGVQLVYELATPQTLQLPPCPIDTLQGVNNIWADTGETTLQYIKIGG